MRKAETIYSELVMTRESDTYLHSGRDSKASREMGKLYSGKRRRIQVCPDCRLVVWESWRQAN